MSSKDELSTTPKLYAQDLPEHPGIEVLLPSFGVYADLSALSLGEELTSRIGKVTAALKNL